MSENLWGCAEMEHWSEMCKWSIYFKINYHFIIPHAFNYCVTYEWTVFFLTKLITQLSLSCRLSMIRALLRRLISSFSNPSNHGFIFAAKRSFNLNHNRNSFLTEIFLYSPARSSGRIFMSLFDICYTLFSFL